MKLIMTGTVVVVIGTELIYQYVQNVEESRMEKCYDT